MGANTAVTIYTQVYNTRAFLPRCVESVLNQTFTDFEYILVDNGSTDGCKEMLERYAAMDSRIRLIRFETNRFAAVAVWLQVARETGTGKYITNLDSDDWLEPDFLERMVSLAEQNHLDIVCTGTAFHIEGQIETIAHSRSVPLQIIMEKAQYADYFPFYHAFFRAQWGKLIRRKVFMGADLSIIDREGITNGADTLVDFAWLRRARRVCIDNSVLHHYLHRNKSISRTYLPARFRSNTVLHQDAVDFLSQYGPVSEKNLHFLHRVYANAVSDTLEVLGNSSLSPDEKLAEYSTIAAHPTTRETYQDTDPDIDHSRNMLLQQFLETAGKARNAPENLSTALQSVLPRCGQAVMKENASLFIQKPELMAALRQDDPDVLAKQLLHLIAAKRYTKQYELGETLRSLAQDKPLLCGLSDIGFLRKYHEIYWMIWQDQTLEALDAMTGLLLENRVRSAEEEFLQLYLSIAAVLEQVPAFLFGKTLLAKFYLRQRRAEDCEALLSELETMGVEETAELTDIRQQLAALNEKE